MEELEQKIGYTFADRELLRTALTHSSYANENRREGAVCNERLEFLGDAVLGMITAQYLYKRFPDMPEGRMTRLRAELVCEKSLNGVACSLGLGDMLLLGRGEEKNGGRTRPSILADAVEAIIAALSLDGGLAEARRFITRNILEPFEAGEGLPDVDYKTALQELVQRKSDQLLEYVPVSESGPDHDKRFTVQAVLNGKPLSTGEGHSKKDAEQAAAKNALEVLS